LFLFLFLSNNRLGNKNTKNFKVIKVLFLFQVALEDGLRATCTQTTRGAT
jgi:hypothetical protein